MNDSIDITNAFADFYKQLHMIRAEPSEQSPMLPVPFFAIDPHFAPSTKEELQKELKSLKSNRCKDSSGLVGEMLKASGYVLSDVFLDICSQVFCGRVNPLTRWKQSIITVLHKSGANAAAELPTNHCHPIAI